MLGVWIVISAQVFAGVPIAGAIAICAWGTALCIGRKSNAAVVLLVYGPLAAVAVAAELHSALNSTSPAWRLAAAVDAAAAASLMTMLVRHVGERITAGR